MNHPTTPTTDTPNPDPQPRQHSAFSLLQALPLVVLLAGLALSFLAWQRHQDDALQRLRDDFEFRIEQAIARIDNRLDGYAQLLEDVGAMFMLNPELDATAFRQYADKLRLNEKFPGTQAIGFLPRIEQASRQEALRKLRRQFPTFDIVPPGERAVYAPVLYIEPPTAENQKVLGYDLLAEPVRQAALKAACDTEKTALSAPLTLVQDQAQTGPRGAGVLIAAPVFRRDSRQDSTTNREAALLGWVAAPLRLNDLISGIFSDSRDETMQALSLRIEDVTDREASQALYDNEEVARAQAPLLQDSRQLEVAGRQWRLHFASRPDLEAGLQKERGTPILLAGTLISVLLAWVLWLLITGRARAMRLAAGMTEALRTSKELLDSVIDGTSDVIFVKDSAGRYQLANRAMGRWFGISPNDIIGKDDLALFPPDIATNLRAADRQQQAMDAPTTQELVLPDPNGEPRTLLVTKGPVRDAAGQAVGIFGIARDITERKQMEQQIALFRSLAEAIGDPVYVIDPHRGFRLTYVNEAASRHFGIPADELLGRRISDLDVMYNDQAGLEVLWEEVRRHKALLFESTQRTANGRCLPVEILANYLLHDGHEYIAGTFRDIGGRKRSEDELRLAASVFQAGSEGIVISDADGTILAVNPAFCELTGYSAREAVGQKTSLLRSGKHDQAFYQAMWQSLIDTGKWQGEIWNRRKDGETYLERLSINTIFHADGTVHRRFAIFSDITEQKQAQDLIWHQANYDTLTDLPNRRLFRDRLQQEIKRAARGGNQLAVMFIDLDRFKEINDTLGHDLGDQLLNLAALRIRGCVRDADTVARLGGDEFTLILPDLKDVDRATEVAQAILEAFGEPFELAGNHVYITTSIGITIFPDDGNDDATLIKHADQAMYATKENGRCGFSFFTPSMQHAVKERIELAGDLRHALVRQELEVYYQPIVNLASSHVHKAEALLRWHHPKRGLVGPAEFIPIAEETGLIVEIGDWVFREAASFAARWRDALVAAGEHEPKVQISVNKSPRQFLTEDACDDWADHLAQLGLPGDTIIIEITEGLLLDDQPSTSDKLHRLRAAGFSIALDDFGTGYSAMSYLKRFPIDYLKIDRSFVCDMESDQNDQAIVEAIVLMAHKLGIAIVAEGVEEDGQNTLLALAECDYAQGYLYGRPQPAADFLAQFAR